MKRCPNPDCPSFQTNRAFLDDDTICPRCGEVLAGAGPGTPVAYAATAPVRVTQVRHEHAILGAIGTLLLVFLVIALLVRGRVIQPGVALNSTRGGVVPIAALTPGSIAAAQATATAVALATLVSGPTPLGGFSQGPTPIGGFIVATIPPGFGTLGGPTPLPFPTLAGSGGTVSGATPGSTQSGTGGLGGSNPQPGNSTVSTQLCRRIDVGQLCEPVNRYGPKDTVYLAVRATFNPNAARYLKVRLYGPPDATTRLLQQDQTNIPGRDGDFWVGFGFSQNPGWAPGAYRADVSVNEEAVPRTVATWTVAP
ncbi:MAG TPA: hypothetical protein VM536_18295 [Chloroflexia bacterium]|nr:hypothetical protein [Chloroflexia bacterium]